MNNRFDCYQYYLEVALEHGYVLTSFVDWFERLKGTEQKVIILRHDVDWAEQNAREMFAIEKSLCVKSSYYFRWETVDPELIQALKENGFEASLHYNTLANYCRERRISRREEIEKSDRVEIGKRLKVEVSKFRQQFGVPCKTLASHGDPLNIRMGISGDELVTPDTYADLGILCEVYDRALYANHIRAHITDDSIDHNYGFSYNIYPLETFEKGIPCIVFLTHPSHWKEKNLLRRFILLAKLLLGRFVFSSDKKFSNQ